MRTLFALDRRDPGRAGRGSPVSSAAGGAGSSTRGAFPNLDEASEAKLRSATTQVIARFQAIRLTWPAVDPLCADPQRGFWLDNFTLERLSIHLPKKRSAGGDHRAGPGLNKPAPTPLRRI